MDITSAATGFEMAAPTSPPIRFLNVQVYSESFENLCKPLFTRHATKFAPCPFSEPSAMVAALMTITRKRKSRTRKQLKDEVLRENGEEIRKEG
jgi:hypothetical protein